MYLFASGNRRQPCISVKHVLKCSNAICEWPELSISIKSVVLYCIVVALLFSKVRACSVIFKVYKHFHIYVYAFNRSDARADNTVH